jgi:hypothetical protein
MPINVSEFKSRLPGGGSRPNLFEVVFNNPNELGIDNQPSSLGEVGSFLVKSSSLPGSTISRVPVPFRGRNVTVPGVREFDDTWVTTVINDTDFGVRRWAEEWMDKIASHEANIGNFTLTDLSSTLHVYQLDHRDGERIRGYKFIDAWPSELNAIELAADTNDSISEFDITWAFSYWMVDEAGDTKSAVAGAESNKNTTT